MANDHSQQAEAALSGVTGSSTDAAHSIAVAQVHATLAVATAIESWGAALQDTLTGIRADLAKRA